MLAAVVGERDNRRHRPGRGFEALRYRFEIVSDYGAFRDLQRHRMLTVQWQRLGPDLGAGVPEEVREAGVGGEFERALEISRNEYERLAAAGLDELAPYALSLAFRIRYVLDLNAREAMHLIELRSGREGHPTYRAVAQAMHEEIAAVHPGVAAAMKFVDDSTEPRLERMMSELRTHRKRAALDARLRATAQVAALALAALSGAAAAIRRRRVRALPRAPGLRPLRAAPRPGARRPSPSSSSGSSRVRPAVLRFDFLRHPLARASATAPPRPPPRQAASRRAICRPGAARSR